MNKILNIFCVLISLFFIWISDAKSQDAGVNISKFTIKDGLSANSITCIVTDKEGFLWIGTLDGLNQYDGYRFIKHRHNPSDSSSISSNLIRQIYVDHNDNIWIATKYGLNRYNKEAGYFKRYLHETDNHSSISNNNLFYIFGDINNNKDNNKDNNIWIEVIDGLNKFDIKNEEFYFMQFAQEQLDPFHRISAHNNLSIINDDSTHLWIATKDGLSNFDKTNEFYRLYNTTNSNISHNEIRSLYKDNEGFLFIGTNNGLNILDKEKKISTYYLDNKYQDNDNSINAIFQDKRKNIWIGTNNGLFIFNKNNRSFYRINSLENQLNSISGVTSFFQNCSDILWVGTKTGLYKISWPKNFKVYRNTYKKTLNFSSNDISSLFIDDDRIWIGTKYDGLNIFNRTTNTTLQYNDNKGKTKPFPNNIYTIHNNKNGYIYIGIKNGVRILNNKTGAISTLKEKYNIDEHEMRNSRVKSIIEDIDGNLWCGSEYGIYWIKPNKLVHFTISSNKNSEISSNIVNSLLLDNDGFIWAATEKGLNKIDYKQNSVEISWYLHSDTIDNSLSHNNVLSLYIDTDNILWIGTEAGLNRYNKTNDNFDFYTVNDGFASDLIYSILEDDNNNLWLGTNHGLSKLNKKYKKITNFDLFDGLQGHEFNINSCYKSSSGELFFGGTNGINSFFPDSIVQNQNIPKISIMSIEIRNNKGDRIVLPVKNEVIIQDTVQMFTIFFSVLDFQRSEKNSYKYILEGDSDNWTYIQDQRYVTFSHLPEGDFVFKVQGANSEGVWNTIGASVNITVVSPWYRNRIAYIIYFILIVCSVIFIVFYFTRKIRKENRILKENKKAGIEIGKQKEQLAIKNNNITSSLHYSKRLINALMPSERMFNKIIPESFILFKPKDIVSGDFYWIAENNHKIFVAAVDCTGHGVPGALMSIIGFNLINDIVKEQNIEEPAIILNKLNEGVAKTFGSSEEMTVRDGMDIALCAIDYRKNVLEYSGAKNPLYLIRNDNIIETKANRFPVGLIDDVEKRYFTNHTIPMQKDDIFYIFSDGFVDQFGGPAEKKFKYRKFRHLLLNINKQPMDMQKKMLHTSFENWKGELEQVDDILIIGIKPLL